MSSVLSNMALNAWARARTRSSAIPRSRTARSESRISQYQPEPLGNILVMDVTACLLLQAGARAISQPPAPDRGSQPMMESNIPNEVPFRL